MIISSRWHYIMISLQGVAVGGLAFMATLSVTSLFDRPAASYEEAVTLTPMVVPGGMFEARVTYKKHRECLGTAIVSFSGANDESRVVLTLPLGDRPPGVFTVRRRYPVPPSASPGLAQFTETLAYQCADGPSVVRSPPMQFAVGG